MKKALFIGLALLITFSVTGTALAHVSFHFFGFFPIPPVVVAPAPVYYYPGYYQPYPSYDDRVWVPGYWGWRGTDHGWERVWVPGYWRYGP
jgi:hypothetical protein